MMPRSLMGIACSTAFGFFFLVGYAASQEGVSNAANNYAKLSIDMGAASRGDRYPPEVFGINWNWLEAGGGIIEYGELLRDRSFRNQDDAMKRAWIESPEKSTNGRIKHIDNGGTSTPWGKKSYLGYMRLSQQSQGYTCISQKLIEVVTAEGKYELHVSARSEGGKPALSVFLADTSFMPIEPVDKLSWIESDQWRDYIFVLNPQKSQVSPYLRLCIVNAGEVGVDEVRLRRLGATPRVKQAAAEKIRELGVRSLRWPTGSDADHFDWRESVAPLAERGENPSAFEVYETPSLGLHEFLNYCEAAGIVPLITVNVLLPPASAADLVEYILGGQDTPMGALRAKNGRATAWNVRHFELGNEPTEIYRADFAKSDAAKGYVKLASAVAKTMRSKAQQLGRQIELKAVTETTFAMAEWIWLVPMLSHWNDTVLEPQSSLRPHVDQLKGNFYSAFTWSSSERELFEEVMGGGATIAATVKKLHKGPGKPEPFWLTEYGVMVQKNRLIGGPEILLERAKDFQAGLSDADILMTAMQEGFGGAYLFNLAQWGTWGVLANAIDFRLRPSGLAFSMLSPFAGEARVPVRVDGGGTVVLRSGKGNNPAKTQYATIAAVASSSNNLLQVAILNRSYERNEKVSVDLKGRTIVSAEHYQLGPEKLDAGNDEKPDNVRIRRRTLTAVDAQLLDIPARSLTRIVYSLK